MTFPGVRPILDEDEYELSQDKACKSSAPWNSLKDAIQFCDKYDNCEGIYDKNCDGRSIFTCGKLTPAVDPDSPSNGCTYIKKETDGKIFYIHT